MWLIHVVGAVFLTYASVSWALSKGGVQTFEDVDIDNSGDLCRNEISENAELGKHFAILDADSNDCLSREEYAVFVAISELDDGPSQDLAQEKSGTVLQ